MEPAVITLNGCTNGCAYKCMCSSFQAIEDSLLRGDLLQKYTQFNGLDALLSKDVGLNHRDDNSKKIDGDQAKPQFSTPEEEYKYLKEKLGGRKRVSIHYGL